MDMKTMGWIKIIGALIAGWLGWTSRDFGVLVLALVVLIAGIGHLKK